VAHPNEFSYLARFLKDWPSSGWLQSLEGHRVLNLGSAAVPNALDYRPLFPDRTLLGVDQQAGPGVDLVCDLTGDCAELAGARFAAVLCCSVLEHCARPWIAAANIERLLAPQGLLYVTVPWIWRAHPYPDDYWRMSDAGVRVLFPNIRWKRIAYFSQAANETVPPESASDAPWRRADTSGRVYLASQLLCMIGRLS